jgi:hypothetical protein
MLVTATLFSVIYIKEHLTNASLKPLAQAAAIYTLVIFFSQDIRHLIFRKRSDPTAKRMTEEPVLDHQKKVERARWLISMIGLLGGAFILTLSTGSLSRGVFVVKRSTVTAAQDPTAFYILVCGAGLVSTMLIYKGAREMFLLLRRR